MNGALPLSREVWLSTKEAAELMGILPQNVWRGCQAGRLRGRHVEGQGPAKGRQVLEVLLASLPLDAQAKYWKLRGEGLPEIPEGADEAWLAASEPARRKASERMRAFNAWRAFLEHGPGGPDAGAPKPTKKALTETFCRVWKAELQKPELSPRTLFRWEADLNRWGGSPSALLPLYGQRSGQSSIPDDAQGIFLDLYLDENRRSMAFCIKETRAWWKAHELPEPLPGDGAFRQLVDGIPHAAKVLHREGRKAFDDRCAPYIIRDYASIKPNAWWVMDHRQIDVAARGPDGRPCFPWVTGVMDIRSRRMLGWYLNTGPNQDTVLAAFRRAALRFGLPEHLLIDNGKDFRSKAFSGGRRRGVKVVERTVQYRVDEARVRSLLAHLQIDPHFGQTYNAKTKPIERGFLTMKEWIDKRFESYRGGRPDERPERLKALWKKTGALPTFAQLDQLYGEYLETVYNEHAHTGDGMDGRTPREVYDALLEERIAASPSTLNLLLMRATEPRQVRRNSIWLNEHGLYYKPTGDTALLPYEGKKIYLRYDLAEVGRAFAFDLEERFICEMTAREALAWGATQEDVRRAMSEKKAHRKAAQAYRRTREAAAAEPSHLKRAVDLRKAEAAAHPAPGPGAPPAQPTRPKVVRMRRTALDAAAQAVAEVPSPQERIEREEAASEERFRVMSALPAPGAPKGPTQDELLDFMFRDYERERRQASDAQQ